MDQRRRGTGRRVGGLILGAGLGVGLLLLGGLDPARAAAPATPFEAAVRAVEAGNLEAGAAALLRLEAAGIPDELRPRAELLLGVLLLRQGQSQEAVPWLTRAADRGGLLEEYALFWLAQALRGAGEPEGAARQLERLLGRHPQSLLAERAARDRFQDWFAAADFVHAEAAIGAYLGTYPRGPGQGKAWILLGEILLATGRLGEAEELFRRVWVELPAAPESRQAEAFLSRMTGVSPLTPEERFRRAMTLHREGRHGQALAELAPFAAEGGPREPAVRLALGTSAFNLRQYAEAARWLAPAAAGPGDERGEALFWLARSLGRAGDAAGFQERMEALLGLEPPGPRAEEGLYLLARSATDEGDSPRALALLERLLQRFPEGRWRDQGWWLQGWHLFRTGRLPEALASWERLLREEPSSRLRPQAAYWRGRALEGLGRAEEAVRAYGRFLADFPDQPYYRMRAAARLAGLGKPVRTPPPPDPAPPEARSPRPHAERGRALRDLGLRDEAAEEFAEQVRVAPGDRAGLGEACQAFLALERYDRAIWLSGRLLRPLFAQGGGAAPIPGYWRCVYPLGYDAAVRAEARDHGVDPYLVAAVIREESAFQPGAVSRTGARGLMQLMPQTAERTARAARVAYGGPASLETPALNIRLGSFHLAELLRDHQGRSSLALAAYNAGAQPVARWLARFGLADEEAFIEEIPYTETRNYVKRVLGSREQYARLYGDGTRPPRAPRPGRIRGSARPAPGGARQGR